MPYYFDVICNMNMMPFATSYCITSKFEVHRAFGVRQPECIYEKGVKMNRKGESFRFFFFFVFYRRLVFFLSFYVIRN